MGQTWFLSVLVLCYFIMLVLKKRPSIEEMIKNHKKEFFIGSIVCQILLSFVGMQIIRPLCFFYGYFWNKDKINMPVKRYCLLTLMLLTLTAARFVFHVICDGLIVYDYIVFGWSFVVLAVWLIVTAIKLLNYIPNKLNKLVSSRAWRVLDLMTYPLFLTHYMFASGEFAVTNWIENLGGQAIAFTLLTCITAFFVLLITEYKELKNIISI